MIIMLTYPESYNLLSLLKTEKKRIRYPDGWLDGLVAGDADGFEIQ